MNRYRYKAINENGKYVSGKIAAENPSDLATMLKSNGMELVSYKQESKGGSSFSDKVKSQDLVTMFIHLEQMDRAGMPILDSINELKDNSESVKIRNLMHEIYESVKKGSLFSQSLAKHPEIFSNTYVALIAMGEKTGNLSTSFASIVDDIKWNMSIKRKTRKAITGPLFGIIVMLIVLGIMTTIVVPKVTGFLVSQELALPLMTISLIKFSDFFKNYWYIIVFLIPVIMVVFKILSKTPKTAMAIDEIKLKIPVFGKIINKIDAAKFCQFFAMTFKSGLDVLDCLESASKVINNSAMRHSIIIAKQQVSDGQPLARAIEMTGHFPNLVVQMFKIGEESGNMQSAMQNINFFYEREINDSIDRLVGMIQPTLTIVMGGMIAWITIAVFGPIYGTFSKLQ